MSVRNFTYHPTWSTRHRGLRLASKIGACVLFAALALSACGSSTTTTTTTSTTRPPSVTSSPIATNWAAFFGGQTPPDRKIALLQDGSNFAAVIKAQASSPMAKSVRVTVSKVDNVTATTARVHYDIYLGSTKALGGVTGNAVLQDGVWKVGDSSFCALLGLEGTKTSACPAS
jgi:uncharacterized protein YcfL